jgi:hypothetical protein
MNNELNEQYLNRSYDEYQKEQMKLMNDFKNDTQVEDSKDIQKQITLLNTITINILRFRNLRKTIQEKKNR